MEVITGGRRSGKTVELIKRSAETGFYILVRDHARAEDLFKLAKQLGYSIPYPVTSEEYFRTEFRGSCIRRDGLYIDNIDEIIQQFLRGIEVRAITATPTIHLNPNKKPYERFLPCTCGCNRRDLWNRNDRYWYKCRNCGLVSDESRTTAGAKRNWNSMIKEGRTR